MDMANKAFIVTRYLYDKSIMKLSFGVMNYIILGMKKKLSTF